MRLLPLLVCALSAAWAHNCVPGPPLPAGGSLTGSLGEANCRLPDGSAVAEHTLSLPTHGRIELQAASDDFAVRVILRDSLGRKLEEGASIRRGVERGDYLLAVTSAQPGKSGAYTLSSVFTAEPDTLCRSARPAGAWQSLAGTLTGQSCRLPDGSAFDAYAVQIFGSGTFEIAIDTDAFEPSLILRDADGLALGADARKLSVQVDGDATYTVVAAARESGKSGAYRLSLNFITGDSETCKLAGTLDRSKTVSGTLRDSSCPLNADSRFDYYRLIVADPGVAELRATTVDAATSLALLDESGLIVAVDSAGGGDKNPVLRPQLAPGRYTLFVAGPKTGTDYSLAYVFTPGLPEICAVLDLPDGVATNGSLSAASCRSRDHLEDLYRVKLDRAGSLDLSLRSGDFTPELSLRDAKYNLIVRNNLVSDSAQPEARLVASVPAGTYTVAASSIKPGGYSVTSRFTPGDPPACRVQTIPVNSGYIADLTSSDCPGPDGQPISYFEFQTPADGLVGAFGTSIDVDPFLTLVDDQGVTLRSDDNGYDGFDSMIVQYLPKGKYRLGFRSATGSEIGRYRVDALFGAGGRPPSCQPLRDVRRGDNILGTLGVPSCQFADDTWGDRYRFELTAPGTADITLRSFSFDAFLQIIDQRGNVLQFNDDSGGATDAHLHLDLDTGVYFIIAKAYRDNGYLPGDYLLSIQ